MKQIFVGLLIMVQTMSGFLVVAQNNGLDVSGSVKESWKGLESVKLTLYKNGSVDQSVTTSSNGKFKFFFETNVNYILDVAKAGYVTKKIAFNTTVPDGEPQVWDFDFIVELFQDQSGLDKAIFANPVAKVHYSARHNEIDYDLDYTMQFQKKEEEVFKELEALNSDKFKEEERKRKAAEQVVNDIAKQLAADQKAQAAAQKQKLAEEERQRKAADQETKQLAAAQKAKEASEAKATENEFSELMKEAAGLAKQNAYSDAKRKYAQASKVYPDRQEPSDKIAELDKLIAQQQKEQEALQLVEAK
ncbi:MAG: hypothetical protein JKX84_08560 [Flavobacteriales bacterium]|nr:hypothetical protein [Flavobacteriales bacterium]